jgi:hypothetical protein
LFQIITTQFGWAWIGIIAFASIAFGAVLSRYFKVFVLIPVGAIVWAISAATGVHLGYSLFEAAVMGFLVMAVVQIGYFCALVITRQ